MKKIISSLILIVMILNIVFVNVSLADEDTQTETTTGGQTTSQSDVLSEYNEADKEFGIGDLLDGITGILFYTVKLPVMGVGYFLELILTGVAKLDSNGNTQDQIEGYVTPDDVIFNKVGLTNINFFDMQNGR